ncbi:hypothetical protein F5B22DRAFT_422226 [Xylaria bambusicola]|uniref:uncharacterized protein n=1 Tax=Xylaria bambusicola TaxID=326684 RepID=UPI0020078062|nr:uncharacterized protein F5B22DRAFT_422226 [Xylaria bambusicola]KAI0523901.1 hypothetical protein F5B22DRAFT_422226 [Xylaria bambusicola]
MDQYRCPPEELPRYLYRVRYPESQTRHTAEGLTAADTTTVYGDNEHQRGLFRQAVEKHFTSSDRDSSLFISLFSDRDHAENWAYMELWHSRWSENWTLCTIDTSLLNEVYVFKVSTLVDELRVEIPPQAEQHKKGAYICLHRVPQHAILKEEPVQEVKRRSLALDYHDDNHNDDDHWDPYYGYDSDDSAVVNNINDNLMRALE